MSVSQPAGDFFRRLVECSPDATVVLDEDLRVRFASPAAVSMAGFTSATDLIGRSGADFIHPEDIDVVLTLLADQAGGAGYRLPMRFRMVRPSGEIRVIEGIALNLLDDHLVGGLLVVLRDVTLAGAVTPADRRTERRFQRMLEHVSDAVVMLDGDRRIINSSGLGREWFGGPDQMLDEPALLAMCDPADRELVHSRLVELFSRPGWRFHDDVRVVVGGRHLTVELRGHNHLDDAVIDSVVLLGTDVSTQREAARARAAAHEAALLALEQRREFVATMSHELRTPIHGILGVADLLADQARDSESARLAEVLRRSGETLRSMVDDILDLSRIEVGRLEVESVPVALDEIGRDVAELFEAVAADKGVRLAMGASSGAPVMASADPLRTRQIVTNLVSNAVKFTDVGTVLIEVALDPRGDATVTVSDTGIGIGSADVATLFEPFAQGANADVRQRGGTGLGLAISQRLAEAMGGQVELSRRTAGGTSATLRLPRAESPGLDDAPVSALAVVEGEPAVLVIEDNETNRFLIERQLLRLGCRPQLAVDGEAGVVAFTVDPPDAVILDYRLPGVDGIEVVRRLRATEAAEGWERRPVIAMTASAMEGDRDACLAAGMDEFLAKPCGMDELRDVLARWVVLAPGRAQR